MKKTIIASTKVGYTLPKEEAILFSGKEAGICYMPDTIETLFAEPEEKSRKRANRTLSSGHHSVFGHPSYCFSIEEIPKIMAMILNNEKDYNTSEKSARYTKMAASKEESSLYEKWIVKYEERIKEVYPFIEEKQAHKLAQENARYLIGVFTPATSMGHTLDLRQLNYILHWMEEYREVAPDTLFNQKLKPAMREFVALFEDLMVPELNTKVKQRGLSLFAKRERKEEWGENYSTNYLATFAQLGQAQRHRTIHYEMTLLEEPAYFVPPIIQGTELEAEWRADIASLAEFFPQGMLVRVNERGTVEDFVLKMQERLCGCAQLEIALQTKETLEKYLANTKETNPTIYEYLLPYSKGARCTFPGFECTSTCVWGPNNALKRKI